MIDPHIVLHKPAVLAVALAGALGGCDLVYGLERPVQQTVCGSFGDEEPLAFGDELMDVTDFSFNGAVTRGFVHGTVEVEGVARTGPVPVVLDDGAWVYDPAFESNWRTLVDGDRIVVARMARDNDLFVSQRFTSNPPTLHVFHYGYRDVPGQGQKWVQIELNEIGAASASDLYPGGELSEVVPGSMPPVTYDFLPVFRFDQVTQARTVGLALRAPNAERWEAQELIGGVSSTEPINEQHQPWSGALARTPEGRQVLIYAATPDGSSENSDLYIAEKRSGGFLQGVPLASFNTEDEELEPWVSEDCTKITFRRTKRGSPFAGEARSGGTIFMAQIK